MEIKKCASCGAFITTEGSICESCLNKANYDNTLLKNYFDETSNFDSISAISAATGVSPEAIQRYITSTDPSVEINPTSFSSIKY